MNDDFLGSILGVAILWSGILAATYLAVSVLIPFVARRTSHEVDDLIVAALRRPALLLVALIALVQVLNAAGLDESWLSTIRTFVFAVVYSLSAWVGWTLLRDILNAFVRKYAEESDSAIDDVLVPLIANAGPIAIGLAAVIGIAGLFGASFTSVLAILGAFSFLLIFALQDPLSNLFSGVYLLTDQPFQIGDFVRTEDGSTYLVEGIGGRVTQLYNIEEHTTAYVPNTKLATQTIVNITKPTVELRVSVEVGVAYECNPEKVIDILESICDSEEHVLGRPSTKKALFEQQATEMESQLRDVDGDGSTVAIAAAKTARLAANRVRFEYELREQIALFLRRIDLLACAVSAYEEGSWENDERNAVLRAVTDLKTEFRAIRGKITVWLTLGAHEIVFYKLEKDPSTIVRLFEDGQAASRTSIDALMSRVEAGTLHPIGELRSPDEELLRYSIFESLGDFNTQISHASHDLSSIVESSAAAMRAEVPELFMLDDFKKYYKRWFRAARMISSGLEQICETLAGDHYREFAIDTDLSRLVQAIRRNLLLPAERWQWPDAKVKNFGESTVDFSVEFFVDNVVGYHFGALDDVLSRIRLAILARFAKEGVEIPFPQRDIRFRTPMLLPSSVPA